jgi:hypothetical protein
MFKQSFEWGDEKTILLKGKSTKSNDIVFDLIDSCFLTRRYCHICGGMTEKDYVSCEVTEGEYEGVRICPRCIESRDLDKQLKKTAKELEKEAEFTRSMIGRLSVPKIDEFNQLNWEIDKRIAEQYKRVEEKMKKKKNEKDMKQEIDDEPPIPPDEPPI